MRLKEGIVEVGSRDIVSESIPSYTSVFLQFPTVFSITTIAILVHSEGSTLSAHFLIISSTSLSFSHPLLSLTVRSLRVGPQFFYEG